MANALNVPPTKSSLLDIKDQLAMAKEGYELLEQKREILVMELMRMLERVKVMEKNIDDRIATAYPALLRMLMAVGGDRVERIASAVHYDFTITEKTMMLAGLRFSSIESTMPQPQLFYSCLETDADVDQVVVEFFELLSLLTQMASIRTIVWRLAMEVKKTQRRVNALEKMVIPQTQETKVYIESVLEERERENIFVLKSLKARQGDKEAA
jgi:V/A-type H+-transporting ATPase subunit D